MGKVVAFWIVGFVIFMFGLGTLYLDKAFRRPWEDYIPLGSYAIMAGGVIFVAFGFYHWWKAKD